MAFYMYVSLSQEDKIARLAMDAGSGALEALETVAVPGRPAPLAVSPNYFLTDLIVTQDDFAGSPFVSHPEMDQETSPNESLVRLSSFREIRPRKLSVDGPVQGWDVNLRQMTVN